jgi:hypothetical protein
MAVPFDPTDPRHLTPEQRLDEPAALLANGLRRASSARPAPAPVPAVPITENAAILLGMNLMCRPRRASMVRVVNARESASRAAERG